MTIRPESPRNPNEKGLTLVELMAALVFIAIGILALSRVQTFSFTDVYSTGRHTRALDVAQMQMETARAAGYLGARSDSGVVEGFAWVTRVDSAGAGLRRVTTSLSWVDRRSPRSLQLVSLVSAR